MNHAPPPVLQSYAVGRADGNAIVVADWQVSRHHARVTPLDSGRFLVEDLGSKNGTFVNGQRIRQAEVRMGDDVRLGDFPLLLRVHFTASSAGGRARLRPPSEANPAGLVSPLASHPPHPLSVSPRSRRVAPKPLAHAASRPAVPDCQAAPLPSVAVASGAVGPVPSHAGLASVAGMLPVAPWALARGSQRFGAAAIDALVGLGSVGLVGFSLHYAFTLLGLSPAAPLTRLAMFAGVAVWGLLYMMLCLPLAEAAGGSWGKQAMGLRLVAADGSGPVPLAHSLYRAWIRVCFGLTGGLGWVLSRVFGSGPGVFWHDDQSHSRVVTQPRARD